MIGRAGRRGQSGHGRSFLIPFTGTCPVDRASCMQAQAQWTKGRVSIKDNTSGLLGPSNRSAGWPQVCRLIDDLFIRRGLSPIRSHLDARTTGWLSPLRRHSVASPTASLGIGPASPGGIAASETSRGFAKHLMELLSTGVVDTLHDCERFMSSTLLQL